MSQHDHSHCTEAPQRRSFLGLLSGLITAGIGAVLGGTIARYSIGPALSEAAGEAKWSELGALSEIPEGKLVKKSVTLAQEAGWGRFESQRSLWVVRKGEEVKIFSAVCPHLGCSVNTQGEKFVCACHGSYWDMTGKTLEGPTPRGLDTLEHRVADGKLEVRYQNFKQGVAEKEVMA